ncbi:MAG: glucose-1-phosphate adenylyltransferase [Candidatus Aminicenantes bacterium]|nr:glucose-1-phosphate adenylyltransferase [Candidatus Aminicenantes bacterium]
MVDVVTSIMAGGAGSRLYPLTEKRSKPAVPIAGRFRLIDIPISNCIHSGLRKIFILTQYSTESLHRHIFTTYRFDAFTKDFITILSAQQTSDSKDWYQGTADAVRQNLHFLKGRGDLVLILSGDHLYRMDYQNFIAFHLKKKADISISVYPVARTQAPDLGIMKVNGLAQIKEFLEKPKKPEELKNMEVPQKVLQKFLAHPSDRTHLASMGIYIFKWKVLVDLLHNTAFEDFGREVIPYAIQEKKVFAYFFDGYWEDIGTIRSFFDVHIELTQPLPKFNFYDENKPIFSRARFLPGSKILSSEVHHSILCEGSIINRSKIVHSIIGIRSRIGENCSLERTIVMGADYFESDAEILENIKNGVPKIGIGNDCDIRNAIIDKNARIGNGVKLVNIQNITEKTEAHYMIREGIIVIPKNSVIPDGTVI